MGSSSIFCGYAVALLWEETPEGKRTKAKAISPPMFGCWQSARAAQLDLMQKLAKSTDGKQFDADLLEVRLLPFEAVGF